MKTSLRRLTFVFGIIGAFALVGVLALRVLIHNNRAERNVYYSTIVKPAKAKDIEERRVQTAALEEDAKKNPGSLARLPTLGSGETHATKQMWWLYDEPHNRLLRWKIIIDGLTTGSILLALFCHAMRRVIIRKEPN